MNVKRNSITVALVVMIVLALSVSANAQQKPPTGNPVTGKTLFAAHTCFGCHGYNGETGNPKLQGSASPNLASEEAFIRFLRLRADKAPMLPVTNMPNYPESSLSDQQARDIYAYIRSFKSTSTEVKDAPALNRILAGGSKPYKP
jgi:mono/diheme cytochrome c family protein